MNRRFVSLALLFTAVGLPAPVLADVRTFRVRSDGGSRVSFVSDAPLETINGVATQTSGEIRVDPAALGGARGSVAVDVAGLRTGIDLRDDHLRGNSWLDATRFPRATFELTAVEGAQTLTPNQPTQVRLRGRFTLHGVTRNVVARAMVRYVPLTAEMRGIPGMNGDVLMVTATFRVSLTDYGVSVPAMIRLKVANDVDVAVNIRAIAS